VIHDGEVLLPWYSGQLAFCKKMRPAGKTLQQKDSLPIKDSRALLVQVCWYFSSDNIAAFWCDVIIACIVKVSRQMPKNVRDVVGPSTLDDLTGTFNLSHRESIL